MNTYEKREQKLFIVAIIAAIVLIISLFLPYITTIEKGGDMDSVSMIKLGDLYSEIGIDFYAVFFTGCAVLIGIFSLITLVGAIKKKPVLLIIFSLLILGIILLMNWDLGDRGVVPSKYLKFGMSYYLYLLSVITSVVTGIVARVFRKKADYEIE